MGLLKAMQDYVDNLHPVWESQIYFSPNRFNHAIFLYEEENIEQ